MTECEWDEIQGFDGWFEFDKFTAWIAERVKSGAAVEVEVENRYGPSRMREEKWFRHAASGQVWRLVWPEPPFQGVFEPVANEDERRR